MNDERRSPKISIAVPVYNAEDSLLDRALDGIFAQTEQDFEIVLVNDGSTNGCTLRIRNEFARDRRLRIINQNNKGVEGAVDTAIKNSKGIFFYSIAQDDYIHPQTLEYCLHTLEDEDADFCIFGGYRQYDTSIPECGKLPDRAAIPRRAFAASEENAAPEEYAQALCGLNMDGWGHFATMKLVRDVHSRWPLYESLTRTNLMFRLSRRWVVTKARLYYYNSANPNSLSRKPITKTYVERNRVDFEALCLLYASERADPHLRPIWDSVMENFILKGVKMVVNWYRRHNKGCKETVNLPCVEEIAHMLWALKSRHALPMSKINFRLYLIYRWIMFRYGNSRQRVLSDDDIYKANHDLYLSDISCVL